MKCKKCGVEIDAGASFCQECGTSVDWEAKICPYCGASNEADATFCLACGKNFDQNVKSGGSKIKIFFIIFVVLSIVGGLAFYYSKNKDDKKKYEPSVKNEAPVEKKNENNDDEAEDDSISKEIKIAEITSSSTLQQAGYNYSPNNLIDGAYHTCWCEGVEGDGINEKVVFKLEDEAKIDRVSIVNGFDKSESLYLKNNRIKTLTLIFDDGEEVIELEDSYNCYQTIKLDKEHISSKLIVQINSVYAGSEYQDTCISEIKINE